MPRTTISVMLSALCGSAAATAIFNTFVEHQMELGIAAIFAAGTAMYTLPGALLLAGVQSILHKLNVRPIVSEAAILVVGTAVGGAVLELLFGGDFVLNSKLLGALYGLSTAAFFVAFQRLIGSRHVQPL